MADNENSGGLSLEALLAAAREASAPEAAVESDQAADASAEAVVESAPAEEEAPAAAAPTASVEESEPAPTSSEPALSVHEEEPSGFNLAAALGYGADGSAPERRASGTSYGSAVSTGSFDLAAALGYAPSQSSQPSETAADDARSGGVNPVAIAEAAAREEQAQAAADVVAREAIARAAREDGTPHYRSRYADLPRRTRADRGQQTDRAPEESQEAKPTQEVKPASETAASEVDAAASAARAAGAVAAEQAASTPASEESTHTHQKAVSRMASASAQAAAAAAEARRAASGIGQKAEAEEAPVTFKPLQATAAEDAAHRQADDAEPTEEGAVPTAEALEEVLASREPAFMSVKEAEDKAAQKAAEEAAAAEAARLEAERAAKEEAARAAAAQQAAALKAQQEAAARAQAQSRARAATAATTQMPPVRPRKAAVTATEEIMVEPLPSQRIGTISYEDAVYADETRQMETAAERKAAKKARRYRRFGTFLIIVALLAAAGAAVLFLQGTAGASEDIETKATEISESAGRTITYRYRAADANGTLCPTTEVATFSTGGVLEQSVITMQTADFETAGHTLAYFKQQFQDSAYVDGRVDNSSVVFTLHMSSEHLMKSTYTALVMTNTVGCEVII